MPEPDLHHQIEETSPSASRHRRLVFQGIVLVAILGFSLLTFLATTRAYLPIDLLITQAFQAIANPWLDGLMLAISWPGYAVQSVTIATLLILLLWATGFILEARVSILASFGTGLLNTLIKLVIQRPRPSADLITVMRELDSFSFPSGHVMFYTAFYGFLFFITYTRLKHSWGRTALMLLFGGLVLLVGPSRIYLGAHWASDVLGAYLLGSLILLAIIQLYRGLGTPGKDDKDPALTRVSSQGRMGAPEGGDD